MTVRFARNRRDWGFGIAWAVGDGWVRPSRRGWGYLPIVVRVGFGPWVWKVEL